MVSECPACGSTNLGTDAHGAVNTISKDPHRVCNDCGALVDLTVGVHLGRGALDEALWSGNRSNPYVRGPDLDFRSYSNKPGLEVVDCSEMGRCHLIFEDCPDLGRIHSVGTSVYDDPSLGGYAKITLKSLPRRSIEVDGEVHTIEISSGYHQISSGLGGSSENIFYPLSTEEVSRDARICINNPSTEQIGDAEHLVIVFQGDENPTEVSIAEESDVRFFGLLGGYGIKKVSLNCERGASRISISGMPDLESVEIRGSTQVLDIRGCPNLGWIKGSGNTLSMPDHDERRRSYLRLSGFWINAPLRTVSDHSSLTQSDILSCGDLESACFSNLSYLAMCEIEENLGISATSSISGLNSPILSIPTFVEAMSANLELVPSLVEWFPDLPLIQDQYYMMRILVSLSHSGADISEISDVRYHVMEQNSLLEPYPNSGGRFVTPRMVESGTSALLPNTHPEKFGGTMESLRDTASAAMWSESAYWRLPFSGFVPMDRIDMELWILLGPNFYPSPPTLSKTNLQLNTISNRGKTFQIFSSWVKQVLPTFLSNIEKETLGTSRGNFIDDLFDLASRSNMSSFQRPLRNDSLGLYDLIAYHISSPMLPESLYKDRFEQRFLEHIRGEQRIPLWAKAAISFGMVQQATTNSLDWQFLIKDLVGKLPIKEASRLRAPSIHGAKAFTDGFAETLEWPYVDNWRIENERN